MIKSFNDYAANERTFLAWVRTAIALMAFGFLLERFDLFLQMAALTMGDRAPHIADAGFGRGAGLGLLVAGVAITAIAAMRFVKNAKDIASDEVKSNKGRGVDIALAILLVLLGLALAVYLSHALIAGT